MLRRLGALWEGKSVGGDKSSSPRGQGISTSRTPTRTELFPGAVCESATPPVASGSGNESIEELITSQLLSDRRIGSKLSGVLIPKLTANPTRIPPSLHSSMRHVLRSNLNDRRVDTTTKENCMRLVATLALEASNADFVLEILQDLDNSFEYVFEGEELYGDKGKVTKGKGGGDKGGRGNGMQRALHTHLLHALFRVLGRQFGAIDLLELSRGRMDFAVVAATEAVDSTLHLAEMQIPDVNYLRFHGCRLLFELTTPDAHFSPGEQQNNIRELAAHSRKQCTQIMTIVLEHGVLQRLTNALSPMETARGAGLCRVGDERYTRMMDEDDDVMSSASAALKMVHNLLLYSDERSAQLRKSLMQSELVTLVLEPFLSRGVYTAAGLCSGGPSGDGGGGGSGRMSLQRISDRAVRHVTNALNVLVVATFKMGNLRQRLLVFGNAAPGGGVGLGRGESATRDLLPRGILAVPLLSSSLAVMDALCRLACNLGVGDDGGGEAAAEGRRRWETMLADRIALLDSEDAATLSARFAREVRALPVVRDCKTHEWIKSRLPPPAPPRVLEDAGGSVDDTGGAVGKNRGGKMAAGGREGGSAVKWSKMEKERERKRQQRKRRRQRQKEAKKRAAGMNEMGPDTGGGDGVGSSRVANAALKVVVGNSTLIEVKGREDTLDDDTDGSGSIVSTDDEEEESVVAAIRRFELNTGFKHGLPGATPMLPIEDDVDKLDLDALLAEVDTMGV